MNPILEESFPSGKSAEFQHFPTIDKTSDEYNPYKGLKNYEKKAVDMRLALLPYRVIQKELKKYFEKDVEIQSIRFWFIEGKPLRIALTYLEQQQANEDSEEKRKAKERLDKSAYDAIGMLTDGLVENNMSPEQIRIAQDILDRTGFPKTSKVEGNHDVSVHESEQFTSAIVAIAESIKK